jgi:hypothetical protein
MKTYSVNKICDIYLYRLYKLEKKKKKPEFLIEILSKKGIFFDNHIIIRTIGILIEKAFISQVEGLGTYTYGKKSFNKNILNWFKNDRKKTIDEFFGEDFLNKIEGQNNLYELTIQGRNFVQNNQIFDIEGKIEKKRERENWKNRIWGYIFGVLTGLTIAIIIKWIS